MKNHLGDYIRRVRLAKKLTNGDVAKLIGYKNTAKGANRLDSQEKGNRFCKILLGKTIEALELDEEHVKGLIAQMGKERQEDFDRWADTPIEPYIVRRAIPGVYINYKIPEDLHGATLEELESHASQRAEEWGSKVCLVSTRRRCTWIKEDGRIGCRTENTLEHTFIPCTCIMGKRDSAFFFSGESQ